MKLAAVIVLAWFLGVATVYTVSRLMGGAPQPETLFDRLRREEYQRAAAPNPFRDLIHGIRDGEPDGV